MKNIYVFIFKNSLLANCIQWYVMITRICWYCIYSVFKLVLLLRYSGLAVCIFS